MRQTHVRGIDLGLLTTLQALVEERSITRAAERMFLSQPAMSRALDRLQEKKTSAEIFARYLPSGLW